MEIAQGGDVWGAIVIELNEEKAPGTAANFLAYVDAGYFDGTIFHRVIPTFMIQGGGYAADNRVKREGLRAPIKNEAANGLKNTRGSLAMARTGEPHSATSQFFINVANNDFLDHPGQDGWGYCVFGSVVEGMEIVDRIKDLPTKRNPAMGENSAPVNPAAIKSARRLPPA
ncbi:MAG: peptidylprolyl isomerase [Planctomycetes bacterium]|nr:peptidylprolyl isomerase [Planctomycetota bacterium]